MKIRVYYFALGRSFTREFEEVSEKVEDVSEQSIIDCELIKFDPTTDNLLDLLEDFGGTEEWWCLTQEVYEAIAQRQKKIFEKL